MFATRQHSIVLFLKACDKRSNTYFLSFSACADLLRERIYYKNGKFLDHYSFGQWVVRGNHTQRKAQRDWSQIIILRNDALHSELMISIPLITRNSMQAVPNDGNRSEIAGKNIFCEGRLQQLATLSKLQLPG
uniref:Uncharacterized protein n=1 Tax=Ascaris lumbricoides TaxID=6252 RepID=A0A0M3IRX3_ASCLU